MSGKEIIEVKAELIENYREPVRREYVEPKVQKQLDPASVVRAVKLLGFAGFAISAAVIVMIGFSKIAAGFMLLSLFLVFADQMI